jgi:pyridinium-3,5-biscarboxylic acid mononucleotide sulfurtransferase
LTPQAEIQSSSPTLTATQTEEICAKLHSYVSQYQSALIAFSGGLDSALVLWATHRALGAQKTLAVTSISASLPRREIDATRAFVASIGLPSERHRFIETNELANPDYFENSPSRCFHCKDTLYTELESIRQQEGLEVIFDGCNLSDLDDYRPGRKAAKSAGVVSPLLACDIDKSTARDIARWHKLSVADKPSSACLSSRVPHGITITSDILRQVDRAESALHQLGFSGFRVRYHKEVARLELIATDMQRMQNDETRAEVVRVIKEAGFRFVALDLEGYRTGSLNPLPRESGS